MGSSEKFCLKAVDDTLRGLQREDPSFLGKREPYTILFEANLGAWQVDRFKRSSEMTKTRKNEGAKIRLSHRDKSRNSRDFGFYNVGREGFEPSTSAVLTICAQDVRAASLNRAGLPAHTR